MAVLAARKKKIQRPIRAKYVCTFVYLDEPQVILLERGKDAKVIAVAIDRGGMQFPFLGAEISLNQLERYRHELVDLRYLFDMPYYSRWFLFDLATLDKDKNLILSLAPPEDYKNAGYLPDHRFFARSHTEQEDLPVLAHRKTEKHILDGTWEPNDISKFFSRVSDLYSFYFTLRKLKSKGESPIQVTNLRKAFTEYPFRGGSSYVNFYRDLASALGFHERLQMPGIQKNSPGWVVVAGQSSALDDAVEAMKHFGAHYETLQDQYDVLHDFLSHFEYLTQAPDRLRIATPTAERIKEYAQALATGLGLDYDEIEALTGNPLSTAKIILSHYRRLERYFLFFAEGRMQLAEDASEHVASSPSIGDLPGA